MAQESTSPQHLASDPTISCWVGASAGTGKTKVLIDRFLKILLRGFSPDSILCLTFTKAAAIEMHERLLAKLQGWAIADTDSVLLDLSALLGCVPDEDTVNRAKGLFLQTLNSVEGVKIQTIHSFCQDLLKSFPLEAGIDPGSTILDEEEATRLLSKAQHAVLERNPPSLEYVVRRMSDFRFEELLQSLQNQRGQFGRFLSRYPEPDSYKKVLAAHLKYDDLAQNDPTLGHPIWGQVCKVLAESGTATDQNNATLLQKSLEFGVDHSAIFLTKDGQIRKTLASKAIRTNHPILYEAMVREADRLFAAIQNQKNKAIIDTTLAFIELAQAIFQGYADEKRQYGFLDFEDLIAMTGSFLRGDGARKVFKDGHLLDHILVDEAQDTSPDQWHIIHLLVGALLSRDQPRRTLFIVGDIKQSIYSFQGAKPKLFASLRPFFQEQINALDQHWRVVDLQISYRTTPAILALVDHVFDRYPKGVCFFEERITHAAYRDQDPGVVELQPLIPLSEEAEKAEIEPWPLPILQLEANSQVSRLAVQIAQKIKALLDSHDVLPSTKHRIQPKDILILVRKRSELIPLLLQQLKRMDIPVAGVDRLLLRNHIAVQDLIALGRFLCLPDDDYSLACVLKSPLINAGMGITEEDLFVLCHERPGSLWQSLTTNAARFQNAYDFLSALLARADVETPHSLYQSILHQTTGYFIARLGEDCQDILNEFLQMAFTFGVQKNPILQTFIQYISTLETQVKRNLSSVSLNQIRVMTVHGSKGLQAPIVIIADSTDKITLIKEPFLWLDEPFLFLLKPSQSQETDGIRQMKDDALEKLEEEHRRLLYVALTRPQDRLYIFGSEKKNTEESWYDVVRESLKILGEPMADGGWQYRTMETDSGGTDTGTEKELIIPVLSVPEWLFEGGISHKINKQKDVDGPIGLRPPRHDVMANERSECGHPEIYLSIDHTEKHDNPRQRGILIHKLFEILPKCQGRDLYQVAEALVRRQKQAHLLLEDDIDKVVAIITHPDYHLFFGDQSLAEVQIAGAGFEGRIDRLQIDRLCIDPDTIYILDYKTTPNPPLRTEDVSNVYRDQLKKYANALRALYQNRSIRTFLLWTEGPHLMEIT
ncbi:MAG: double-strand break repair helicase AddA [Alphaproteobacteria bacterium]|nr:double-strand break repair helicase AddA [Alphaproteobacteria bacterium]